ncbi:hypothetical protein NPIL_442491, partial [Nephila pilipes]
MPLCLWERGVATAAGTTSAAETR